MTAAAAATLGHNWRTPQALYGPLDQEFAFTLDVCADDRNSKHVRYFDKDTDALRQSWAGERVFCNPPYGRELGRWIRKGYQEARENGALVVFLIPARTGNSWFHDLCLPFGEIRFIRGRLGFALGDVAGRRGKARAPFDSMIVVFRPGAPALERPVLSQYIFPFLEKSV